MPDTSLEAKAGVLVCDGYGITIRVEKRHLVIMDGAGRTRRKRRLARVGHGITRIVILGHTGTISLEALRWLDRVGIPFAQIDTDGAVLANSARQGLDDGRLRRAQALAPTSSSGLTAAIALLDGKLAGQAANTTHHLTDTTTGAIIEELRQGLHRATTITDARALEATAANYYFSTWTNRAAITWATRDHSRIPDHWRTYQTRRSPLRTSGPYLAADPVNALLNYLYALAETECRLACLTLGLDPALGIIHTDSKSRDSLALDLIEPIRPTIDAYTLDLVAGHIFRAADFYERDDGHCRILPPLTHHLAATLPIWRDAIAPWAEQLAHILADASPHPIPKRTPLTSTRRRQSADIAAEPRRKSTTDHGSTRTTPATPMRILGPRCQDCGTPLNHRQRRYCPNCWPSRRRDAAATGSAAASATASDAQIRQLRGEAISQGKRTARDRRLRELGHDPDDWERDLRPRLARLSLRGISDATGLSTNQASRIKRGQQVPRPEHWANLQAALDNQGTSR